MVTMAGMSWKQYLHGHGHVARTGLLRAMRDMEMPDGVRSELSRMTVCGKRYVKGAWGGFEYGRVQCNSIFCPACMSRLVKQEAERAWKALDADTADPDDLSYVTINWESLDLSWGNFRQSADQFKGKLRRTLDWMKRQHGIPLRVHGQIEIGLGAGSQGKLHGHFWVHHDGILRKQLKDDLRSRFNEDRAVNVKPIRDNRIGVKENFKVVSRYTGKMIKKLDEELNPETLIMLMTAYEQIRHKGRVGLRFQYGTKGHRQKRVTKVSRPTIPNRLHVSVRETVKEIVDRYAQYGVHKAEKREVGDTCID
jgi:hypothetical protein